MSHIIEIDVTIKNLQMESLYCREIIGGQEGEKASQLISKAVRVLEEVSIGLEPEDDYQDEDNSPEYDA